MCLNLANLGDAVQSRLHLSFLAVPSSWSAADLLLLRGFARFLGSWVAFEVIFLALCLS
jgi:hypothetical protein